MKTIGRRSFIKEAATFFTLFAACSGIGAPSAQALKLEDCEWCLDDLGRSVLLPRHIKSLMPMGPNAQVMLEQLCPNKIASLSFGIRKEDLKGYKESSLSCMLQRNVSGSAFGTVEDRGIDLAVVSESLPDAIIDAGIPDDGLSDELDWIASVTGVPVFFVDISFGSLPSAFGHLGRMLGMVEKSTKLMDFCERTLEENSADDANEADRVLYAPGINGVQAIAEVEIQLSGLRHVGCAPVVDVYDFDSGALCASELGSSCVDLVLLDDLSLQRSVFEDDSNQSLEMFLAIAPCFFSPAYLHSWFGSSVFLQEIGLYWIKALLEGDACSMLVKSRAIEFYSLFYGSDLSEEEIDRVVCRNQWEV